MRNPDELKQAMQLAVSRDPDALVSIRAADVLELIKITEELKGLKVTIDEVVQQMGLFR